MTKPPRRPLPRAANPEPQISGPKKEHQAQIIMTIKERNVTIFECTAPRCKWSRLDLGNPIIAEQEAMTHLKTHAQGEDNLSNG